MSNVRRLRRSLVIVMGRKLTPFERELYQRTDEVMHYVWDPIGVAGEPMARDEYDSYLPLVFAMLLESNGEQAISAYLIKIERECMGLTPSKVNADRVASILFDWYETLREKYAEQE